MLRKLMAVARHSIRRREPACGPARDSSAGVYERVHLDQQVIPCETL
jgi:hypothetical protein